MIAAIEGAQPGAEGLASRRGQNLDLSASNSDGKDKGEMQWPEHEDSRCARKRFLVNASSEYLINETRGEGHSLKSAFHPNENR